MSVVSIEFCVLLILSAIYSSLPDCASVLTEQPVTFSAFDYRNDAGSSSMHRTHVMHDEEFYCASSETGEVVNN